MGLNNDLVSSLDQRFRFRGRLVGGMNFYSRNSILKNAIFGNNFHRHDILGVFGMQIEFLKIFDKFPKISLIEVVAGGHLVAASDRQWVAFSSDKSIMIFSLWQIFPFHRNIGFP